MTSNHCFSKLLKEDFKHKIWMLVLSVIGNFLALPACFMIYVQSKINYYYEANLYTLLSPLTCIDSFVREIAIITSAIVAMIGAVIVGIAGFRYLYHRDMVDTFHAIPVKRRTLFLVNWLNGFLIWFVPFLLSWLCALAVIFRNYNQVGKKVAEVPMGMGSGYDMTRAEYVFGSLTVSVILKRTLFAILIVMICFFLVYHVVILALMLTGNLLNTALVAATIGGGVFAIHLIFIGLCTFLDTYVSFINSLERTIWASPIASAVNLIRVAIDTSEEKHTGVILLNLLMAALLLAASYVAYEKRPSELAGAGTKNPVAKWLVQGVLSFSAAIGGWMVMYVIVGDYDYELGYSGIGNNFWEIFGALLAGIFVFGALNVCFQMDFKSFLNHKLRMLLFCGIALLTASAFRYDWFGYDSYLAKKEDVASISVFSPAENNSFYYIYGDDWKNRLDAGGSYDTDVTYALLESVISRQTEADKVGGDSVTMSLMSQNETVHNRWEQLFVKVTLKNGRSYYRSYDCLKTEENLNLLRQIFSSEAYLEQNFLIPEDTPFIDLTIRRDDEGYRNIKVGTDLSAELLKELLRAYNQDLLENPTTAFNGVGKRLCNIELRPEAYRSSRCITVTTDMTHTIAALQNTKYADYVRDYKPEQISKILLPTGLMEADLESMSKGEFRETILRNYGFNVFEGNNWEDGSLEEAMTYDGQRYVDSKLLVLEITDTAEIEELLPLLSYTENRSYEGLFFRYPVSQIGIRTTQGGEFYCEMPEGVLPETYLQRMLALKN